jgi:uncharacterized protein YgiB involved in biofilm formation
MKRKQLILTSAMAATLGSLAGCSSSDDWSDGEVAEYDTAVCVDQNGNRVDDDFCDDDRHYGRGLAWFYVSRGSRLPYYGDSIHDKRLGITGSAKPDASKSYFRAPSSTAMTRSAAVSRGGFGSSSRGFGGGRS